MRHILEREGSAVHIVTSASSFLAVFRLSIPRLMRCEPMFDLTTQPTSGLIVVALLACVTCQGCAFRASTPQPTPHSPLLATSTLSHLEAQHQRAQFLNTTHTTPSSAPPRRTRKKPRSAPPAPANVVTRQTQKREAKLPSLSILKKESVTHGNQGVDERALLSHLDAHLANVRSSLHDPRRPLGSVAELHQRCKKLGRIDFKEVSAKSIVFFHNTHDANGDGRNNDWYTFAAIAHKGPDATQRIELATFGSKANENLYMSIAYPDVYTTEGGIVLNSHIRQPTQDDLPYTRYLSGELFAGSCRV